MTYIRRSILFFERLHFPCNLKLQCVDWSEPIAITHTGKYGRNMFSWEDGLDNLDFYDYRFFLLRLSKGVKPFIVHPCTDENLAGCQQLIRHLSELPTTVLKIIIMRLLLYKTQYLKVTHQLSLTELSCWHGSCLRSNEDQGTVVQAT